MNGEYDWPKDQLDGPYGYYGIVIQKDAIRLGCNGPRVPIKSYKDIYDVLAVEQEKLVREKPRTLEEAFRVTEGCPFQEQKGSIEKA